MTRASFARLSRLALCLLLQWVGATSSPGADTLAAPPQGAALLKTDLLGVFAHPDDETGMAATVARYALGSGKVVVHAYATRGEGGGNMVGTQSGRALGILREAELRACLKILGVRHCYFLDQTDFFYTESAAAALKVWNRDDALAHLVRLIRTLRPEIIVTMNPAPNPGQHGHHQAAGILATEAFQAAADPRRYPDQLRVEGLVVWQARKLFYGGAAGPRVLSISATDPLLDGRIPAEIAGLALSEHRSQAFGGMAQSPWMRRPQTFTLVHSTLVEESSGNDLFHGLPIPESDPTPTVVPFASPPPEPPIAFVPRPGIERYQEWGRQQRIRHLSAEFLADLPVVAGEANPVILEINAARAGSSLTAPRLTLPDDWKIAGSPELLKSRGVANPQRYRFSVIPPVHAMADAEITATADIASQASVAKDGAETDRSTKARLHPIPLLRVPRVPSSVADAFDDRFWTNSPALVLGTNSLWQGRVTNTADCSAEVRLARSGNVLLVDTRVYDDRVVSNIKPNDIRGHWRSDSIEICLDPAAGAEDTLGCFKIGIFPFDTTGRVRAARDADARPGPVEETAPGLRLRSERTADGYRIQASIPLDLVLPNRRVRSGQRLGFNLLVYDGDKANALPGENINEARLAWAPRSGIQGRPEDWGRIDLE
ncbi:MAG: PIG-L family deacetylase [Verrucomicrobiales bacterium]|nr:PIG-L family deacetylase [Verrucomicrobiales bacterium]